MSETPTHNASGVCATCGGEITYVEYTAWNGLDVDVLDAWWSHIYHPADGHTASPA